MPALLDEHTPDAPTTQKGRLRQQLEDELAARATQASAGTGRLRSVVLRAGDFHGQGSGSWFDQLIVKKLAQGRLVYPGPADVPHAWAYLPDLARAFTAVAERALQGPLGPTCHTRLPFAGHTLTGAQLLDGPCARRVSSCRCCANWRACPTCGRCRMHWTAAH